jgi:hypothetical protein
LDIGYDFVPILAFLEIINKDLKIKNKEVDFVPTFPISTNITLLHLLQKLVKTPTSTDESPQPFELFFISRKAREGAKTQGNKE